MPPAMPAPLPLTQRVEGAENPLCPVPCAPHTFPFPWHKEGCPGPPLSLLFTPPAAPSPPISRQRGERVESPHPVTPPFPAPSHACLPHLHARTVRKGAAHKGKGQGRAAVQQAVGEHRHRCGCSAVRNTGWGGACEWKGGGTEKGSGGGGEP